MSRELPDAVFTLDGTALVPTDLARGPWHEHSQHGSAMAGALARAIETAESAVPMQVVRLTMDLIRAAPFAPVEVALEVRHAGKSMDLVEASLISGGEVYARAHAVRYRVTDLPVGAAHEPQEVAPPLDPDARIPLPGSKTLALHDALHLSPVRNFEIPAMWVRMLRPLVLGEPLTPLVRVAVALDWVYAAVTLRAWMRDPRAMAERPFIAINTDNHVTLTRPAEGEWICLDASAIYGPLGAGTSAARLFDQRGILGFGTQTLLQRGLDKRPKNWGD